MSGIAGFLDWHRDVTSQQETLRSMHQTLLHRGRTEDREHLRSPVALAHASGLQPDFAVVSFEGFLYNGEELRHLLQAAGHPFVGESDAEVVQKAYLHWGLSFVERLYGAFAFALWDERERHLLLGRDQIGIQPLYYANRDGVVPFGSEIKALLQHPFVSAEVDAQGWAEVFAMGPLYTPGQAVFRDIREVLPGHLVIVTPDGIKTRRYWKLESAAHTDSLEESAATLRRMLEQNVAHHVTTDDSVSLILSGGLDSSGLTALAAKSLTATGRPLRTYSINTRDSIGQENEIDLDAPWVYRVASIVGSENIEILVDTPDILEAIGVPVRAHDLPIEAELDVMHYLVYKRVSQDTRLTVLGEASDEIFDALDYFYDQEAIDAATFPWVSPALDKILTPDMLQHLRADEYVQDCYQDALREVPRLAGETAEQARIRELSYLTITRFLPYLLRRADRLTMAARLEQRLPFGDPRLVQYVWNLPTAFKNHGGQTKGILREAFRSVLPDDVIYRKKSENPIVFNQSYSEYLRGEIDRLLSDTQSPLYPMLNTTRLRTRLEERPVQTSLYWRYRVDYLLQVERWMKEYGVVMK